METNSRSPNSSNNRDTCRKISKWGNMCKAIVEFARNGLINTNLHRWKKLKHLPECRDLQFENYQELKNHLTETKHNAMVAIENMHEMEYRMGPGPVIDEYLSRGMLKACYEQLSGNGPRFVSVADVMLRKRLYNYFTYLLDNHNNIPSILKNNYFKQRENGEIEYMQMNENDVRYSLKIGNRRRDFKPEFHSIEVEIKLTETKNTENKYYTFFKGLFTASGV